MPFSEALILTKIPSKELQKKPLTKKWIHYLMATIQDRIAHKGLFN